METLLKYQTYYVFIFLFYKSNYTNNLEKIDTIPGILRKTVNSMEQKIVVNGGMLFLIGQFIHFQMYMLRQKHWKMLLNNVKH